jgi:hypothetical protein
MRATAEYAKARTRVLLLRQGDAFRQGCAVTELDELLS